MERVDPEVSGNDSLNWVTNNGFNVCGMDVGGSLIIGTPGKQNSRYKFLSRDISFRGGLAHDIIWTKKGSPYRTEAGLVISEGTLFFIEPGVTVELTTNHHTSIKVMGTLKAIGTKEDQIIFTSNREKMGSAGAGNWHYLNFTGPDSVLENVVVKYGGYFHHPPLFIKGAIHVENTNIIIRDSIIENNRGAGVWLVNSDSLIENTLFRDNKAEYYYPPRSPGRGLTVALYIENSDPTLKNLTFEGNTFNIYPEPTL